MVSMVHSQVDWTYTTDTISPSFDELGRLSFIARFISNNVGDSVFLNKGEGEYVYLGKTPFDVELCTEIICGFKGGKGTRLIYIVLPTRWVDVGEIAYVWYFEARHAGKTMYTRIVVGDESKISDQMTGYVGLSCINSSGALSPMKTSMEIPLDFKEYSKNVINERRFDFATNKLSGRVGTFHK